MYWSSVFNLRDVNCFIPTDSFHILPLRDVSCEGVKESVDNVIRDREAVKHTTLLNYLAKRLGFPGGHSGFKNNEADLLAFKAEHNLVRRTDLLRARLGPGMVAVTHRLLADRLFESGRPIPRRVFTGYDIDWETPWKKYGREDPNGAIEPHSGDVSGIEKWLSQHYLQVHSTANLLSDQLLTYGNDPTRERPEPVEWCFRDGEDTEQNLAEARQCRKTAELFRRWICLSAKGWVNVIPYPGNDRLVFLSSGDGEYDFVVQGQRDRPFDSMESDYGEFLKLADLPCAGDLVHYQRWLYFEYRGHWEDMDSYRAEEAYHKAGGAAQSCVNGVDLPLKQYLAAKGVFCLQELTAKKQVLLSNWGFRVVSCGGKNLWVSDPVTVSAFRRFMEKNPEYAAYSRQQKVVDPWVPSNDAGDGPLPAAATWFDAVAFTAWLGKEMGLGLRLLAADEYIPLAKAAYAPLEGAMADKALCISKAPTPFAWMTDKGLAVDIDKVPHKKRQSLLLRYCRSRNKTESHPSGLRFLVSPRFGEWLGDDTGMAVNTATLTSMWRADALPQKYDYKPTSNGMQDSIKIGFRLCCPCS